MASPCKGIPEGGWTKARLASLSNFSSLQSMAEDPKLWDSWLWGNYSRIQEELEIKG